MEDIVAPLERAVHAVALALASADLTHAETHVLARLAEGPTAIGDLHRAFGHKRSTLTAVLDRLEAKGLARRAPHPQDRRAVLVALTPAGRPVARRVRGAIARLEREVAAACTPADLTGFRNVLGALTRATGSVHSTSIASPNE